MYLISILRARAGIRRFRIHGEIRKIIRKRKKSMAGNMNQKVVPIKT